MHAAALLSALQGASVSGAATSPGGKLLTAAAGSAFGAALTAALKAGETAAASGSPVPAGTPAPILTAAAVAAVPTFQSVPPESRTSLTGEGAPLGMSLDPLACLPAPHTMIDLGLTAIEAPLLAGPLTAPVEPPSVSSPGGTPKNLKRAPDDLAELERAAPSSVDVAPVLSAQQPFGPAAPAAVAAAPAMAATPGAAVPLPGVSAATLAPQPPVQTEAAIAASGARAQASQLASHVRQQVPVSPTAESPATKQVASPKQVSPTRPNPTEQVVPPQQAYPTPTEAATGQTAPSRAAAPFAGQAALPGAEGKVPAANASSATLAGASELPITAATTSPSAPAAAVEAQPSLGAPTIGAQAPAPAASLQAAPVVSSGALFPLEPDTTVASGEPATVGVAAPVPQAAQVEMTFGPVVQAGEVQPASKPVDPAAQTAVAATLAGLEATPKTVARDGRAAPLSAQHRSTPRAAAEAASPAAPTAPSAAPASPVGPTASPVAATAQPAVIPALAAATTLLPPEMTAAAVVSVRGERVGQTTMRDGSPAPATGAEGSATGEGSAAGPQGAPTQAASPHGVKPDAQQPAPRPPASAGEPVALEVADSAPDAVPAELRSAEAPAPAGGTGQPREAPLPVRGSPETMASLAAEIARKLDGRNTRFEIQLDPLGLGVVNVSIDIAADGKLSAQMAFERPEAAAELRGRGAELQRALEQAGFDLSRGGLSFEHGHGRERPGGDQPRGQHARAHAFQQALLAADAADSLPAQPLRLRDRARGLDVRI